MADNKSIVSNSTAGTLKVFKPSELMAAFKAAPGQCVVIYPPSTKASAKPVKNTRPIKAQYYNLRFLVNGRTHDPWVSLREFESQTIYRGPEDPNGASSLCVYTSDNGSTTPGRNALLNRFIISTPLGTPIGEFFAALNNEIESAMARASEFLLGPKKCKPEKRYVFYESQYTDKSGEIVKMTPRVSFLPDFSTYSETYLHPRLRGRVKTELVDVYNKPLTADGEPVSWRNVHKVLVRDAQISEVRFSIDNVMISDSRNLTIKLTLSHAKVHPMSQNTFDDEIDLPTTPIPAALPPNPATPSTSAAAANDDSEDDYADDD